MHLYFTELSFIFLDIVVERLAQHFGMSRGHNYARLHAGLGGAGHHTGEVDYDFIRRVDYHCQIRIDALGLFFAQLNIDSLAGVTRSCGWWVSCWFVH